MVRRGRIVRYRSFAVAALIPGALAFAILFWRAPPPTTPAPAAPVPSARRSPDKATAPVNLWLQLLTGGGPGEVARVRLVAEPWGEVGRLDLNLELPEGVRLRSGTSRESGPAARGRRSIEIEVEVPPTGVHRLMGEARVVLPDGKVLARSVILDLPEGARRKADPLPRVELPGGGTRIEIQGESF